MRVAVVSDIHSNRPAFEAVLAAIAAEDCDAVWCLGDLVGYGAEPDACVALAAEHCDACLAGNHDLAVTGSIPMKEFSGPAAAAARWTKKTIRNETRDYLKTLEPTATADNVGLYHGSPRDPVWEYVLSDWVAELCFDATDHRIGLIGHSHIALSFQRDSAYEVEGNLRESGEQADLEKGNWLLNPGSVGQPRDGDPRAAWMLLDTEALTADWRRAEYDVEQAIAAIEAAKLPQVLGERLRNGQ